MPLYRFESYCSVTQAPLLTARLLADFAANQKLILDVANCPAPVVKRWAGYIVGPLLAQYSPAQINSRIDLHLPPDNPTAAAIRKEYNAAITLAKETFQIARYVGGTVQFLPPAAVQPEEPALRAAA